MRYNSGKKNKTVATLSATLSVGVTVESMTAAIQEIGAVIGKYEVGDTDLKTIEESLKKAIVTVKQ